MQAQVFYILVADFVPRAGHSTEFGSSLDLTRRNVTHSLSSLLRFLTLATCYFRVLFDFIFDKMWRNKLSIGSSALQHWPELLVTHLHCLNITPRSSTLVNQKISCTPHCNRDSKWSIATALFRHFRPSVFITVYHSRVWRTNCYARSKHHLNQCHWQKWWYYANVHRNSLE